MNERAHTLEIDRGDLRRTRVAAADLPDPAAGQVLLRVERFAVTANNVTYANTGDLLGYWDFFPTDAPWGRVPVMAVASTVALANAAIPVGRSYFGFLPMATHLLVDAAETSLGFLDAEVHRARHALVYRSFTDLEHEALVLPPP